MPVGTFSAFLDFHRVSAKISKPHYLHDRNCQLSHCQLSIKKAPAQNNCAGTKIPRYHPDFCPKGQTLSAVTEQPSKPNDPIAQKTFSLAARERTSPKSSETRFQPRRISLGRKTKATLSVIAF